MLGLSGSHRSGKTTLAEKFKEKHGWRFAQTSVSAIFRELGHEPSETFDFQTRLTIQEQILIRLDAFYKKSEGASVVTDRTPICMLAYTLAEAIGDAVLPEDQARLTRYTNNCFETTNKYFSTILVVQPGIPIVSADGKAALNQGYIDHLNALIVGLCSDERLKVPHFFIPRARLDMDERVKSCEYATNKMVAKALQETMTMESRLFH